MLRFIEKVNRNNLEEDLGLAYLPVAMFPQHGPDPLLAQSTQVLLDGSTQSSRTMLQYNACVLYLKDIIMRIW